MTHDLPTGPSQPTDYDKVRAKEDAVREKRNRETAEATEMLEPKSYGAAGVSQAISLKRIADAMERLIVMNQPSRPLYGDMMGNVSDRPPPIPGAS